MVQAENANLKDVNQDEEFETIVIIDEKGKCRIVYAKDLVIFA